MTTWPFPLKPLPDKQYQRIPFNPDNYEESPL
jgi:hypothetical protein